MNRSLFWSLEEAFKWVTASDKEIMDAACLAVFLSYSLHLQTECLNLYIVLSTYHKYMALR